MFAARNMMFSASRKAYAAEVLADSPVAYWRLGEASGTTAVDQMGAYNGTYVGSPTLGVAGAVAGDTAATFNGSTQYASQSSLSAFSFIQNTAIFTVEFWIKNNAIGSRKCVIGNTVTNSNRGFICLFENGAAFGTRAIRFFAANGTTGTGNSVTSFRTADNVINDSDWHHVVITHSAAADTSAAVYVDGVSQSITYEQSFTSVSTGDSALPLFIAAANNSGSPLLPINGGMDEVSIYPAALSADRILAHYNARNNP